METFIAGAGSISWWIGYCLKGEKIEVSWKVRNVNDGDMYFGIGGHPAFLCPIVQGTQQTDYFLKIGNGGSVISFVIGKKGLLDGRKKTYNLENGFLRVTEDLFDDDALVIENHQVQEVSLCKMDKQPYLTVRFDAPLFGIWSPPGKKAPFICIEPWYGRCDSENFFGSLENRDWENKLAAGGLFAGVYEIEIC